MKFYFNPDVFYMCFIQPSLLCIKSFDVYMKLQFIIFVVLPFLSHFYSLLLILEKGRLVWSDQIWLMVTTLLHSFSNACLLITIYLFLFQCSAWWWISKADLVFFTIGFSTSKCNCFGIWWLCGYLWVYVCKFQSSWNIFYERIFNSFHI